MTDNKVRDNLIAARWRPIETAPRDGSEVDLWCKGKRWTDCIWTGKVWFTPHGIYDAGAEMEGHGYYPEFWMYPPAPPADAKSALLLARQYITAVPEVSTLDGDAVVAAIDAALGE